LLSRPTTPPKFVGEANKMPMQVQHRLAYITERLEISGESEAGDNENDGEDDEEEAIDDDGQTTPVGLGRDAS